MVNNEVVDFLTSRNSLWGWRDGSVGKMLALKAQGPEFGFLALMQTAGCSVMACACNPSTRETGTGTSLVLVSQPV